MGQGCGGFYSYEWLENIVGCDIHNADRIITEFQLHPKVPSIKVAAIETGRALVLHGRADTQTGNTFEQTGIMPRKYLNSIWMWFLDELEDGTTRLRSRGRGDYRGLGNTLSYELCFMEPLSFMISWNGLRH